MQNNVSVLNTSVREMTRDELVTFLYRYIHISDRINARDLFVNRGTKQANQYKAKRVRELEEKYSEFYLNNVVKITSKIEDFSSRVIQKLKPDLDILFRFYFLSILVIRLTYHKLFSAMAPSFWNQFFTSFLYAMVIYILRRPLKFLFLLFLEMVFSIVKMFGKLIDEFRAKTKGISKSNAKDVFNYHLVKKTILTESKELLENINKTDLEIYDTLKNEKYQLNKYIPAAYQDLYSVTYMYQQIINGLADNWKEAARLLEEDKKHRDVMKSLDSIKNELKLTNSNLRSLEQSIQDQSRRYQDSLERELSIIGSRIDAAFDTLVYY